MKVTDHLENLEPLKLAQHQSKLVGAMPLGFFSRVAEMAWQESKESNRLPDVDEADNVQFELEFSFDENRQMICKGNVKASVGLQCQRCMSRIEHEVDSSFIYAFVTSDEKAAELPGIYDPVLFDGYSADLKMALEDEILLALPAFPIHETNACRLAVTLDSDDVVEKKPGPFAGLTVLLKK
jgi:uncharacterized protein